MRIFRRITENRFDLAYKGARRAPFFVPFLNVKTGAVIFSASVFILCSKSVLLQYGFFNSKKIIYIRYFSTLLCVLQYLSTIKFQSKKVHIY